MRPLLALAAGFALAALTIPVLANSAPTQHADALTQLQRRVSNLEKTGAYLRKQVALQIRINSAQVKINSGQSQINSSIDTRIASIDSRVTSLETAPAPAATMSSYLGVPAVVSPRSWGYPSAFCLNGGTLIGGGFDTNYPVEIGRSKPSGTSWDIAAYNPYNQSAVVTPYAICLTLSQ